jgi:hypothetical protein
VHLSWGLKYICLDPSYDRLCGLVVRVPGYSSRGPVRFPPLLDFPISSGSGTGSTQPREYNWGVNREVACFQWDTNWIFKYYLERNDPPLWSSGQSSWLQIQRFGFDYLGYQIFWEVVGLERGPPSLVSTTEELLGGKISGSGLEIREYGRRDPSHWSRGTLHPQKLVLTSPTSGFRSVGIVRSRTQVRKFFFNPRRDKPWHAPLWNHQSYK